LDWGNRRRCWIGSFFCRFLRIGPVGFDAHIRARIGRARRYAADGR
jgi:hypothetical protein